VELVSLSPEGRILLTLKHGKHTYSELKFETELSDRWLTIKLEELIREEVVQKYERWYGLRRGITTSPYEISLYMSFQARRIADNLARLNFVRAIILFGRVAQKRASEYSDLDLIIVVRGPFDRAKRMVTLKLTILEKRYHVTVEPLIMKKEDFLSNLRSEEGGIIYGVAEGYRVLVDRTGVVTRDLQNRIEQIKSSCEYLEEGRIWLRVK